MKTIKVVGIDGMLSDERWARNVLGETKVDQLINKWDREGVHKLDMLNMLWKEAHEHAV